MDIINQHYKFTVDNKGTQYLGITLEWDYNNRMVRLSMPGYVPKALKWFGHEPPPRLQEQPYQCFPTNYRAKVLQYVKAIDNPPPLMKEDKTFFIKVTGTFLFYSRLIDSTMLPSLSAIGYEQNLPIENSMKRVKQFLNYSASQEEAIITFSANCMVLVIHSDAS